MPRTALILAGHGSHISPNTAGLVWAAVDELRRLNAADEVTAAFWKEMPSFATVFDSLTAEDVTIVPLFTAQGYFTRVVIPAEMNIDPAMILSPDEPPQNESGRGMTTRTNLKRVDLAAHPRAPSRLPLHDVGGTAHTVRYARTLGEHRKISEIVRARVEDAIRVSAAPREQIAVAIIGHSTRRNPESRKATEAQAMFIRASIPVHEVVAVYLDDEPSIPDVYRLTRAPVLIAVPYFLASGSHTTMDVPRALGLDDGQAQGEINGRRVVYTPPIGSVDEMVEMIFDLAAEAGAPLHPPRAGTLWDAFPYAGRSIAENLLAHVPQRFGQLHITRDDVRHIDDAGQPGLMEMDNPDALRKKTRENPFRPLATAMNLPRGWHIRIAGDPARLHAVIETIYPGVLGTSRYLQHHGVSSGAWGKVIKRQTGLYRPLAAMDASVREAVTAQLCRNCALNPVWAGAKTESDLLCREPCNFWLSAAIEGK